MADNRSGFKEIEHTADWALEVWAPDLSSLFTQAAKGMYWLMDVDLAPENRVERVIELEGTDSEDLLVAFLSELLYFGENEGLAFDRYDVTVDGDSLRAHCQGAPVLRQSKEIKAVTYHNLKIRQTPEGCQVVIVFDV